MNEPEPPAPPLPEWLASFIAEHNLSLLSFGAGLYRDPETGSEISVRTDIYGGIEDGRIQEAIIVQSADGEFGDTFMIRGEEVLTIAQTFSALGWEMPASAEFGRIVEIDATTAKDGVSVEMVTTAGGDRRVKISAGRDDMQGGPIEVGFLFDRAGAAKLGVDLATLMINEIEGSSSD